MARSIFLLILFSTILACQKKHELKFDEVAILSNEKRLNQLQLVENPSNQQKVELAGLSAHIGNLETARELYSELSNSNPHDAEWAVLLGEVLFELEEYQEAAEHLEFGVRSGIVHWNTYQKLAISHTKLGNYEKVGSYIASMRTSASGIKEADFIEGNLFWQKGDTISAISSWREAEIYESHYNVYRFFSSLDSSTEALIPALEMLKLNTYSDSVYGFVGLSLLRMNHQDSARSYFLKSISLNKQNKTALDELAGIHYSNRVYDSTNYYSHLLIDAGGNIMGLLWQARVFDRRREFANSRAKYQEVLELDPVHEIAQLELAKLDRKIRYLRTIRQEEQTAETNNQE